jgi:hypothetical protein
VKTDINDSIFYNYHGLLIDYHSVTPDAKLIFESIFDIASNIMKYQYYKKLDDMNKCNELVETIKLMISNNPDNLVDDYYNMRSVIFNTLRNTYVDDFDYVKKKNPRSIVIN